MWIFSWNRQTFPSKKIKMQSKMEIKGHILHSFWEPSYILEEKLMLHVPFGQSGAKFWHKFSNETWLRMKEYLSIFHSSSHIFEKGESFCWEKAEAVKEGMWTLEITLSFTFTKKAPFHRDGVLPQSPFVRKWMGKVFENHVSNATCFCFITA